MCSEPFETISPSVQSIKNSTDAAEIFRVTLFSQGISVIHFTQKLLTLFKTKPMPKPLKCPQCGASDANLLQDAIYQCKFCGSIYEYGEAKPVYQKTPTAERPYSAEKKSSSEVPSRIIRMVILTVAIMVISTAASIFFTVKSKFKTSAAAPKTLYKDYNETTGSFSVVNTKNGPEVWTISRKNTDGLKEVSYFLNKVDVIENAITASQQIDTTITWEQSFKDPYKMGQLKPIDSICWLIFGDKLSGFNVNTMEEIVNHATLIRQFRALKNGIAAVEDVYDMKGFKLTTKDGFIFYYAANTNTLFTEKEYKDRSTTQQAVINKTEYCFTEDERQQLYKVNRKVKADFSYKLSAYMLSSIIKDDGGWYRKSYNINSVEEVTPNKIYFKASVLYNDENNVVFIYKDELGEQAPIILKCLDASKNEVWTKTGQETELLKPFLKSTNSESFLNGKQLVIMQPYQLAVCLNIENGEINWSFKPY